MTLVNLLYEIPNHHEYLTAFWHLSTGRLSAVEIGNQWIHAAGWGSWVPCRLLGVLSHVYEIPHSHTGLSQGMSLENGYFILVGRAGTQALGLLYMLVDIA